ncbi:hypothetical protein KAJ83_06100 [Marivibrio halodurans]|uniref:Uncharacterized protein n=1 Tax=Marivibrio halodurans TaxID=2039722 RepID=A0A8J7V1Y0_9PROT|nr:hypothetical protein [Marivibrio halodurans]MBP5856571.1 hypothetical protein [Marivibrio halodurans]
MSSTTDRGSSWLAAVTGAAPYRGVGAATRARMAADDGYRGYEAHSIEDANQALGTPAAYYRVMGAEESELDQPACLMRLTWSETEAAGVLAALRGELDADPTFEESAAAYLAEFDPARHHLFVAHDPETERPVGYVRWQCALSIYPDGSDGPDGEEAASLDAVTYDACARLILSIYPELFYVRPSFRERRIGGALAGAIQAEIATHVEDVLKAMRAAGFPGALALVFYAEVESEGGSKLIEAIAQSLEQDIATRNQGRDLPPIEVSLEHREKQTP